MNRHLKRLPALFVLAAILAVFAAAASAQSLQVDPKLVGYRKVSGVSGNLNSIGSDTLNNLMTLWAEAFRKVYPNVNIQIEGKGSSTAPPALIEGTSQLGPMSRTMKSTEVQAFEGKFGFKPTAVPVAIDALAVFVHKDNPIKGLSLAQVDAIFSRNRNCGFSSDIATWGQAGLDGSWRNRSISLYGRNSASGTYGVFKKRSLCEGDYKDTVKEQPGSASVVQGVETDLGGIGYSGIGYRTSGVRVVPLSAKGTGYVEANPSTAADGKYPLARLLYIYVPKAPSGELNKLTHEFLRLVLSREGQQVVIKDGYYPLTAGFVKKQLALLD
jgi:phosphate transport system substrate-binding protein